MGAKTLKLTRRAALLRGRLERGELSEDRLALAAFLNDSAAQELVEYPEPPLREDEWVNALLDRWPSDSIYCAVHVVSVGLSFTALDQAPETQRFESAIGERTSPNVELEPTPPGQRRDLLECVGRHVEVATRPREALAGPIAAWALGARLPAVSRSAKRNEAAEWTTAEPKESETPGWEEANADYVHLMVPAAKHWDYLPSKSELLALLEALRSQGLASSQWNRSKTLRIPQEGSWTFFRKGSLKSFIEQVDSLEAERLRLCFKSRAGKRPRGEVLDPTWICEVQVVVNPLLQILPDPFDEGAVAVSCTNCDAELGLDVESLWPGEWASAGGQGLPRHCVECGHATAPGKLRGRWEEGSIRSPFFRFAIECKIEGAVPFSIPEVPAGVLEALREATGVSFRSHGYSTR